MILIETLESQILGDRYMLARINEKGKYIKDVQNTQKIQGSQFDKIIKGIVESKLYIIHIIYALILSIQNRKARGNDRYEVTSRPKSVRGNESSGAQWCVDYRSGASRNVSGQCPH